MIYILKSNKPVPAQIQQTKSNKKKTTTTTKKPQKHTHQNKERDSSKLTRKT